MVGEDEAVHDKAASVRRRRVFASSRRPGILDTNTTDDAAPPRDPFRIRCMPIASLSLTTFFFGLLPWFTMSEQGGFLDGHRCLAPSERTSDAQCAWIHVDCSEKAGSVSLSGFRRLGIDLLLWCLLFSVVGVQPALLATSAKINPSTSGVCPDRCMCTLPTTGMRGINVTCSESDLGQLPALLNLDIGILNVSNNLISVLPDRSFENAKSLQVLDLGHNRLALIEDTAFYRLRQLTHLYLDHNALTTLHRDLFNDLVHLVHLDLSHNELTTLPSGLFAVSSGPSSGNSIRLKLSLLRHLDLGDNPNLGSGLQSNALHFSRMHFLGLRHVGLSDPDVVMDILKRTSTLVVDMLDISQNQITYLAAAHLDVFKDKVHRLDLSGNPFTCDCSILSFVKWLKLHTDAVRNDWILPKCQIPGRTIRNASVLSVASGQIKVKCDVATKCRSLDHSLADLGFDRSLCPPVFVAQVVTDLKIFTAARTTTVPLIPYDSIRTTYDPMLGWYTAMALMGMVFALILCILFERVKKKYQNYRYRLWTRKMYKTMEASGDLPDLCPNTWNMSAYPCTNSDLAGYRADSRDCLTKTGSPPLAIADLFNHVHPACRRMTSSRSSLVHQVSSPDGRSSRGHHGTFSSKPRLERCQSSALDRRTILPRLNSAASDQQHVAGPDVAAGGQRPAGRPALNRSQSTAVTANKALTHKPPLARSASTALSGDRQANSGSQGDTEAKRRKYANLRSDSHSSPMTTNRPTVLGLAVNNRSSTASVHGTNVTRGESSPTVHGTNLMTGESTPAVHPLWDTLTQVMCELKVAEVNPECPLHNRKNYQRLKALIQNNPNKSLDVLLNELNKRY